MDTETQIAILQMDVDKFIEENIQCPICQKTRIRHVLSMLELDSVADLILEKRHDLLKLQNISSRSIQAIQDALGKYNLSLGTTKAELSQIYGILPGISFIQLFKKALLSHYFEEGVPVSFALDDEFMPGYECQLQIKKLNSKIPFTDSEQNDA